MGEIVLRPVPMKGMKQCLSGGTEAIVWLAFAAGPCRLCCRLLDLGWEVTAQIGNQGFANCGLSLCMRPPGKCNSLSRAV